MKIAFISAWPYGLRGTPGTYRFVERMTAYAGVLILSPIETENVVFSSKRVPILPAGNLFKTEGIQDLIPALTCYDPDIIYIFNFANWHEVLKILKSELPDKKYVLDIKTPLLIEGPRRKQTQKGGLKVQDHLDAIVTLSAKSVDTWLPSHNHNPVEYPLGIDLSMFPAPDSGTALPGRGKFVYISTLHPKRKTKELIHGFADFIRSSACSATLDIYGGGPDLENLKQEVRTLGMGDAVRLMGLTRQEELLAKLPAYDAGIAWVPYEYYDASPSLKSLEYMAAGLRVLASDTAAHKQLADEGFCLDFFSNDGDSLKQALTAACESDYTGESVANNIRALHRYDYDSIIRHYHLPLFYQLAGREPGQAPGTAPAAAATRNRTTNDRIKLMVLCPSLALGKGGAERVATEMACEMIRRGHCVYMAFKNTGKPAYPVDENMIFLPYETFSDLKERLMKIDPDVLMAFYFNRDLIEFYGLVHGTGIPFCMQECTNPTRLIETNWAKGGIDKGLARWEREVIGAGAARIRMVMPGYETSFADYIKPNIRAFSNPCFAQEKTASPGDDNGRKAIININGFKQNKNLLTLVKAFSRLASDYPDWDIKVYGKTAEGNQPHKKEIVDYIASHDLQDRVLIMGPRDDLMPEYADAHLHVIASLSEGCPTCVLEAMSVGLPSIGYADCPGTNRLIVHEKNGLLASADNRVAGLASVLEQCMASGQLRNRLGQQALADSGAFVPEKVYDQWDALLCGAAAYKADPDRLLSEQMAIDPELALHALRMRDKLVNEGKK